MTKQILERIRKKASFILSQEFYTVYDAKTDKEICPHLDIKSNMESLGFETEEEFRQLVEDVRAGRNTKYKILFNFVDVRDPASKDASSTRINGKVATRHEVFEFFVRRDLCDAVSKEIRNMESVLVLPMDMRTLPEGFSNWDDFKSYYKSLKRWLQLCRMNWTRKLPPMRDDGVTVEHSGTLELYESPAEKVALWGCGLVGAGWLAFIGISFVACILMWVGGCLKGCSMSGAYSEEQLERIIH